MADAVELAIDATLNLGRGQSDAALTPWHGFTVPIAQRRGNAELSEPIFKAVDNDFVICLWKLHAQYPYNHMMCWWKLH